MLRTEYQLKLSSSTHYDSLLMVVLVKNKIEYRKRLMTLIQATVRMWKVRREYLPRYVEHLSIFCHCSVQQQILWIFVRFALTASWSQFLLA